MIFEQAPLAKQVEVAMEKLESELAGLTAGTIVFHIRENVIGKFGVRHLPMDCGDLGKLHSGMTTAQVSQLREMAVQAFRRKGSWTHGELALDFAIRQDRLQMSVQVETNYNMANLLFRFPAKRREQRREQRLNRID